MTLEELEKVVVKNLFETPLYDVEIFDKKYRYSPPHLLNYIHFITGMEINDLVEKGFLGLTWGETFNKNSFIYSKISYKDETICYNNIIINEYFKTYLKHIFSILRDIAFEKGFGENGLCQRELFEDFKKDLKTRYND